MTGQGFRMAGVRIGMAAGNVWNGSLIAENDASRVIINTEGFAQDVFHT